MRKGTCLETCFLSPTMLHNQNARRTDNEATRLWWDCMRGFSNVLEARNPTTIREFAGTLCSVAEKQRELVSLANDGRLSERELTERVLHPDQP